MTTPFNPKTTRNKGKSSGDGDQQRWQSVEARGRKIYEMRERESYAQRFSNEMRKREGGESQALRGERKNC